ncbi:11773_t:CDS:2 [Acaulospora morrowiae]|uniref:11773_t:CDS:1 n=1 Tax=Acaulospora morrowiae TaxID=94023 RepID=A0A9N8ZTF3_9GLOM|nr:11773_t:CDS:2 [Acaulospora morrowiae]
MSAKAPPVSLDQTTGDTNGEEDKRVKVQDNLKYQKTDNWQANDDVQIENVDFIPLVNEVVSKGIPSQVTADRSFLSDDSDLWTKFTSTSVLYIIHDKLKCKHPNNFSFIQDLGTLKFKCLLTFGDRVWASSLHSSKRKAKHETSLVAVRDLAAAYPDVLDDVRNWFEQEFGSCASKVKEGIPSNLQSEETPLSLIDDKSSSPSTHLSPQISLRPVDEPNDPPEASVSNDMLIPELDPMQAHDIPSLSPYTLRDRTRFHPYVDASPSALNVLKKATTLLYEWCSKRHIHAPEYLCKIELGGGFSFELRISGHVFSGPVRRNKKEAKNAVSTAALNHFKTKCTTKTDGKGTSLEDPLQKTREIIVIHIIGMCVLPTNQKIGPRP